jgi:hypothetical protein
VFSFTLLGIALIGLPLQPGLEGDCALHVRTIPESALAWECKGSCESEYSCTERQQLISGTFYYYCKCLRYGFPPEPDSTLCTTVVTWTESTNTFEVYCAPKLCAYSCDQHPLDEDLTVPCFCDN